MYFTIKAKGLILASCLLMTVSCGGGGKEASQTINQQPTTNQQPSNSQVLPIPDNSISDQFKILFIGNSHVRSHNMAEMIKALILIRYPNKIVEVGYTSFEMFLNDRMASNSTLNSIKNKPWTHVIIQSQKYSQSGRFNYPTTAAQFFIAQSKEIGATPILFPEHPQVNNSTEALLVHTLHKKIANKEPSCIAPVGLTWDAAVSSEPSHSYHEADGNHAALTGVFLTSLVFYQVITNESADVLPFVENIAVNEELQEALGQIVANTIESNPPCAY